MPAKSGIQAVELLGWVGGLNKEADPYQLQPDESPDALNVDFGVRGEVLKRKGYSTYATHAALLTHVFNWQGNIIMVENSAHDVFYLVGTTSTDSTLALGAETADEDYNVSAVSMNNKIWLVQHNGTIVQWDGTTWSTVSAWDGTVTTAAMPQARSLAVAHNRIWAGGVRLSGGTEQRSRVYFSEVIDPTKWITLNFFDIAPDNGQAITALAPFGDQIFVFKENSLYQIVGSNELEFDSYLVDGATGTQAPGTIANVGLSLFFFDHLRGVYQYDGQGFARVSEKINTYLLDGVNKDEIHKARGVAYRNRYYLSVPWGASTTNSRTFVYDPEIQAWTEYDLGFADMTLLDGVPLAVGVKGGNHVSSLFDTNQDLGVDINGYFKTAWLSPASPSVKHRLRRLDMTMSALGDYDVDVIMRRDFGLDTYVQKSVNTDLGAALFGTAIFGQSFFGQGADQIMFRDAGWGQRWRSMQLEIAERTDGDFQLNRMILNVSTIVRNRGDH